MKRLVIAEPAARDLEGIVDYIALDNPVAAERVYRGIVGAAQKLPQFPALGRPGRHPETRELGHVDKWRSHSLMQARSTKPRKLSAVLS